MDPATAAARKAKDAAKGLTPPPGAGSPAWTADGVFFAATDQVVVVQGAEGTPQERVLKGLSAKTGKQVWRIDTAQPPGKKLQEENALEPGALPKSFVFRVGDALVVQWSGETISDGLKKPTKAMYYAVFSLDSGKQRGSLVDGEQFGYRDGYVSSPMALSPYGDESRDGAGVAFLYPDGKVRRVKPPNISGAFAPKVIPLSPTAHLVTSQDSGKGFFQSFKGASTTGKKTECSTHRDDIEHPVVAADGSRLMWGETIISVNAPGKVICLSDISEYPLTSPALTADGDLYFQSQEKPFLLAHGSKSPKPLPDGTTLPLAVSKAGMVFGANVSDGEGVLFYKAR